MVITGTSREDLNGRAGLARSFDQGSVRRAVGWWNGAVVSRGRRQPEPGRTLEWFEIVRAVETRRAVVR